MTMFSSQDTRKGPVREGQVGGETLGRETGKGGRGGKAAGTGSMSGTGTATGMGTARSILRGELDKIGLPTLLTILEMERRTGLVIVQQNRQLGRLHVREGRVIRAGIEGAKRQRQETAATGAEAVYRMLTWGEGQFELWQASVDGRDEIGACTAFLLMEGARRMDEARGETAGQTHVGLQAGVEGAAADNCLDVAFGEADALAAL